MLKFRERRLLSAVVPTLCLVTVSALSVRVAPPPTPTVHPRVPAAHAAATSAPTPGLLADAARGAPGFNAGDPDQVTALAMIERSAFAALPAARQAEIADSGLYAPPASPAEQSTDRPWSALAPMGDDGYEVARLVCTREVFDSLMPVHQHALVHIIERRLDGLPVGTMCFAPGTPQAVVDAFDAAVFGIIGDRFQQTNRWSTTATNGGGLQQGQPTTLTYSFVPDGTAIPNINGFGPGTSNLQAFLNGIYSNNPATWKNLYAMVLTRWSQLGNVTYVLENADDGSQLNSLGGSIGVRGDLRFAGMALDGPSNVLAYNNFPNDGDMVLDTSDTYFNTTTNTSRRLRNVLAHEHGHGLGMAHVCPANSTKLMEPFVSTSYDGPQFDDTLNIQRHYGDLRESNDTAATATVISNLSTTLNTIAQLSVDDNSDNDYFSFNITAAPRLLKVTARPLGTAYNETGQNQDGSCGTGVSFNPLTVNNLIIDLIAANGTTVLATTDLTAAGTAEVLSEVVNSTGTYYARVRGGNVNNIQAYQLEYQLTNGPATIISVPNGTPSTLTPGIQESFTVRVQSVGETLVGTPQLNYRTIASGPFTSVPLVLQSGDVYTATLPGFLCSASPQFYISAQGSSTGAARLPAGTTNFAAILGSTVQIFFDNAESNAGWTFGAAGDTATQGLWNWANPSGTTVSGVQVQPEDTASGSLCYFTGASAPGASATSADVDGGFTTLISPIINCTGYADAIVSYARWYTNSSGASPNIDTLKIDVSTNGGTNWTRAETVGPTGTGPGWVTGSFSLLSLGLSPTTQVQVRFIAEDASPDSTVEAAIDDFKVEGRQCSDPPPTGPCCLVNGQCIINTQTQCQSSGGTQWSSMGNCASANCPPATGSCCFTNGDCLVRTQAQCGGGTWVLLGVCDPNPCTQPTGSCCFADGHCTVTLEADCTGTEWTMFGICDPNPCPQPPTGACCNGTVCSVVTSSACASGGGSYLGNNAPCLGTPSNPITCCPANYDQVAGVNSDDLFVFLDDWFGQNGSVGPGLSTDMNHTNQVDSDDMFFFLDIWFSGCD